MSRFSSGRWSSLLGPELRFSIEEIRRRQWQRLSRILRHAYETTEFYRDRFDRVGLRPRDLRSLDDLRSVPITTRKDLSDPVALLSSKARRQRLRTSRTSGSTGERTVTYFDRRAWLIGKYLLKARARWACGVRPGDRIAVFEQGEQRAQGIFGRLARQRRFSIVRPYHSLLPEVRAFAPSVVYGFPSYLVEVARQVGGGIRPRLTFTSGEMLDARQRALLTEAFATEVMDVYGCTEVKEIAWQCRQRQGYHINADWLVVEIVDAAGGSSTGEGSVVVTGLYNRAMPLIRYEVGDTGRLRTKPCSCGLALPLMEPCFGRKDDYVRAANGTLISPLSVMGIVRRIEGVEQYQVVQERDQTVRVKIVPEGGERAAIESAVRRRLETPLDRLPVRVEFVSSIPRAANGKFRFVISKV